MTAANEIHQRLDIARTAARDVGEYVLDQFTTRQFQIDRKKDASLVTTVDREAERMLRAVIEDRCPDDGIVGEELGEKSGVSPFRWFLDPIDGTRSFVQGVPLFGCLIGIEHDDRAVAGLILMPALHELVYAAEGGGAWHEVAQSEPQPARVSDCAVLNEAVLSMTSIDYFEIASDPDLYVRIAHACECSRGWSDCYGHVLCATGRVDGVVEPMINSWDICPMIPIMQEAGGRLTDWTGNTDHHAPRAIASNGLIHHQLLEVVQPYVHSPASAE